MRGVGALEQLGVRLVVCTLTEQKPEADAQASVPL